LDDEKISELLNYIITVPTDPTNKKESYKFPFVASQILSCECKTILEFFIKPTSELGDNADQYKYFEKLLNFVNVDPSKEELNYTLAGYFMKVVNTIILAKPKEALLYIYNNPRHTDNLINHLYSKSITNLLVVIINAPKDLFNESAAPQDINNFSKQIFEARKEIFQNLIRLGIKTSYENDNQELHINICSILIDMMIRVDLLIDGKELYKKIFEEKQQLEELFEATIPDAHNGSSRLPTVLWNLMETAVNNYQDSNENLMEIIMSSVEKVLDKYASYLTAVLNDEIASRVGVSTFGSEMNILGKQPVKIAGVVLAFLKTNHYRMDKALYSNHILRIF